MAYSSPKTNPACFKDHDQEMCIREIYEILHNLQRKTASEASDPDKQAPVAPLPPRSNMRVSGLTGFFTVEITNPQYEPIQVGQIKDRNQARIPIDHLIESSTNAQFDGNGDVQKYGPSPQTHWTIRGTGTRYWRLRSSHDGENFTKPILHAAVTA